MQALWLPLPDGRAARLHVSPSGEYCVARNETRWAPPAFLSGCRSELFESGWRVDGDGFSVTVGGRLSVVVSDWRAFEHVQSVSLNNNFARHLYVFLDRMGAGWHAPRCGTLLWNFPLVRLCIV